MIALISSVPEEGNLILKNIKNRSASASPHLRIVQGKIHGKDVIYAISGMGKTNAAHAATILIEKFSPDLIILFGVGGAYPSSGLRTGDIAVAEKEVYGDEGILAKDGFHDTRLIGIPLLKNGGKKYFNEFPLDKKIVRKCVSVLKLAPCPLPLASEVRSGIFATVSACTGTRKRALELKRRHNAICENMEGAAVAHTCAMYGTPMLEIRGISNMVEDRDKTKWQVKLAADNCQKALLELTKKI